MAKKPAASVGLHLAASLRVVSTHLHMRRVTVKDAQETVTEAAKRVAAGDDSPELAILVARLEKVTGQSLAELAKHAETWAG